MCYFKGHENHGSWYISFVALLFGYLRHENEIPEVSYDPRVKVMCLPLGQLDILMPR